MKKYKLNPQKTRAILIGVSKYIDFDDIKPVLNNVKTLGRLLIDKSIFGLPEGNVKIIKEGDSTSITQELIHYTENAKKEGINTLILYFAGHGYRRTDGQYFLATTNTRKNLVNLNGSTALPYSTVKTIIKNSRLSQNIIILDACYSGLAVQGEAKFQELELEGAYTITSSAGKEVSYFDNDLKYTLFTGELLNILEKGLSVDEEMVSLNHLYLALQKAVKIKNPKMSPQQLVSKQLTANNYFFFKNKTFDYDKEAVEGIEADIEEYKKFIFKGHHQKAKRRFENLLEEVEEDITNTIPKNRLSKNIKNYIVFCNYFTAFKPIIEAMQLQKNAIANESRDLAVLQLNTIQQKLSSIQSVHQYEIENMNNQLIIHKKDITEQRLIIRNRDVEISQLRHAIKQNEKKYQEATNTIKEEYFIQLKRIEKEKEKNAFFSKSNYPRLLEINNKLLPSNFLIGPPSDYRRINLFDVWKQSLISEIYVRDIFIHRVNRFVFEEHKIWQNFKDEEVSKVGGWILGRYHKIIGNKLSYKVVFERFIQLHRPDYSSTRQLKFGSSAWHDLEKAIDLYREEGLELVGWFHTHPGSGVFLSKGDMNVHNTIFKNPYQIAMVLESINKSHEVGFFSRSGNGEKLNTKAEAYHNWSDFSDWLKLP